MCMNHAGCAVQAERVERWRSVRVDQGEQELEQFRAREPGTYMLRPAHHCDLRQIERSFTWKQVVETVREGGEVIERSVSADGFVRLALLGWTRDRRNGRIVGKPMHVVVVFHPDQPEEWLVLTGYDPSTKAQRWADGYSRKVCWCDPHHI